MLRSFAPLGLAIFLAGCGGGTPSGASFGKRSPVSGVVKFADGSPVKGGMLTFTPVEANVGSEVRPVGDQPVDANGKFTFGTGGLVPGEYKVSIKPREMFELPNSNVSRVGRAFNSPDTTTARVTITDGDNNLDIVLK